MVMTPPYHPPCLRTQRSRRGLARTTSSLHRNTGARIALLYTVSILACSYVILNGTLAKVRRQYCAESGCSTLTSRDINEFHEFAHRFVLHAYAERTISGRSWVPCIRTMYSGHRYDTSRHHVACRRGAFDRDAVGVFVCCASGACSWAGSTMRPPMVMRPSGGRISRGMAVEIFSDATDYCADV